MRLLSTKEIADLILIESKIDSLREDAIIDAQRDIDRVSTKLDYLRYDRDVTLIESSVSCVRDLTKEEFKDVARSFRSFVS